MNICLNLHTCTCGLCLDVDIHIMFGSVRDELTRGGVGSGSLTWMYSLFGSFLTFGRVPSL